MSNVWSFLNDAERKELDSLLDADIEARPWVPQPGPQAHAYAAEVDVLGYGGAAGCLSADSEVLTPRGWVRMDSYEDGTQVAVWSPDGTFRFEHPIQYIDAPATELIHFASGKRLRMALSADHRVPHFTRQGKFRVKTAHAMTCHSTRYVIPTQCVPADGVGLPANHEELRLATLAICAERDGVKTTRRSKLIRLAREAAGDAPREGKGFACMWGASKAQMHTIIEALEDWYSEEFKASSKADADFMQFAAHATGRYASITEQFHVFVSRGQSKGATLRMDMTTATRKPAQRQYCFTTSTGFFVARYRGCVFATGNSGKTSLAMGLALTKHTHTQFFRREGPQLKGAIDHLAELVGREDIRGVPAVYRTPNGDRQIEFNAMPNSGDELKYQGRPKDLLVIDEAPNFLESQVRFVKGWVRTTKPGQRTMTLMTFNPPTTQDGRWVVEYFAPWIDKNHRLYPTAHGEVRYAYHDPAQRKDIWLDTCDPRPFVLRDGERSYDIPEGTAPENIIKPESRTFIGGRVSDNKFLMDTGYVATLQALPEPLRSQMLYGDFESGRGSDPWQVIPTQWIEAAQDRWTDKHPRPTMVSMGVDVARGGADDTVIVSRHEGMWFAKPIVEPGKDTPDGQAVAGLTIAAMRDQSPIHIDVIGVGASPFDLLRVHRMPVFGVNVAERATRKDKSGRLNFKNLRSQLWWQMREALDPINDTGICLPPDARLRKELSAPRWALSGFVVEVESRKAIISRIGYSPDLASAFCLALIDTPKSHLLDKTTTASAVMNYNPYMEL